MIGNFRRERKTNISKDSTNSKLTIVRYTLHRIFSPQTKEVNNYARKSREVWKSRYSSHRSYQCVRKSSPRGEAESNPSCRLARDKPAAVRRQPAWENWPEPSANLRRIGTWDFGLSSCSSFQRFHWRWL